MTTSITVLAFGDDVDIFNRNLGDRYSLSRVFGIAAPLARAQDGTTVPNTELRRFEAKLSTAGLDALRLAAGRDGEARQLRLSEAEYFGMRLSAWRDIEGTRYEPHFVYDLIARIDQIASYKIAVAVEAGNRVEAVRLQRARSNIIKRRQEKRADELALEKSLNAMLTRNRHHYRLPAYGEVRPVRSRP